MPVTYQQTSVTGDVTYARIMSAGAAAGTVTVSVGVSSAGAGLLVLAGFETSYGVPGTATWSGACTMRWNIVRANSNITFSHLQWRADAAGGAAEGDDSIYTNTVGLAIGLGTTGVKTASIEGTSAFVHTSTTASSNLRFVLFGTSGATMSGNFGYIPDATVTAPFTDSAAAPALVFNLATTKVGS